MKKTATALTVLAAICLLTLAASASAVYQTLPFSQDWTNTGLITATNNWSGVPGIEGFGGTIASGTYSSSGGNPQGILDDALFNDPLSPPAVWVIANVTGAPSGENSGGVYEFQGTSNPNPSVGMQGSGTADAPFLKLYLNTTGKQNIRVQYDLRDIDCQSTATAQLFALHYRVGTSGLWTNVAAGYVANAAGTSGGQCTQVTHVDVTLPAAANNVSQLQVRVMTCNASGSDEMIGVDNISITGADIPPPTGACCLRAGAQGACVMATAGECAAMLPQPGIFLGVGVPCDPGVCATPAAKASWGQVKTIYR